MFCHMFFFFFLLLLMTCVEYASVTAPALVMGKLKQSHLDSWFNMLLILWLKQISARLGSEAYHKVIFILFLAFVAYCCRQNNAVKNKVSIRIMYLILCLSISLWHKQTQRQPTFYLFLSTVFAWKCIPHLLLPPIFHYTFSEYFSLSQPNEAENKIFAFILKIVSCLNFFCLTPYKVFTSKRS